jgi:hypothetical protein
MSGVFILSRTRQYVAVLEKAIDVYTTEFERFIKFMGYLLPALVHSDASKFTSLSY